MMRLFVQHAGRTVIVALNDGDTMTDLMDKCANKFGDDLPASFRLCLDVDGRPIVDELDEVRDGDKICVKATETKTPTVSSSPFAVEEEEDEDYEDSRDYDSEDVYSETELDEGEEDEEDQSEEDEKDQSEEDEEDQSEEDEEDQSEEDEEDQSEEDDDYVEPTKKRARTERPVGSSPITLEAVMDESVVPPTNISSADAEIKERIRSILHRGLHPNTPEVEAANSMRLAERMLRKHNVSRAEVMMNAENASENGDMVKVHVRNSATKKPSTTKLWFQTLARAVSQHFKCKYFFNVRMSVRCYFAFYGLSSNAYAAAFAFETAFNRIMMLASQHKVPTGEYERRLGNDHISVCRATYTKSARQSYCFGLAVGLKERVDDLATSTYPQPEEIEYTVTTDEETRLACVTKKVEDGVLEKNEITLKKNTSKYTWVVHRGKSYAAGKKDSFHIDLQQRTLA